MKSSQALYKASVKLQKQHMWERETLLDNHRQVLTAIADENTSKLTDYRDDKVAYMALERHQNERHAKLVVRQKTEITQMESRHQRELNLLGQG